MCDSHDSGVEIDSNTSSGASMGSLSCSDSISSLPSSAAGSTENLLETLENSESASGEAQRLAVLSYEQVKRLDHIMQEVIPIHGRGNFPTLEVKLKDLIRVVRAKLERDAIHVKDIRLNGGAASHVLTTDNAQPYNDLDLIFAVDLSSHKHYEKVKQAVLSSLLDFMPEKVNKKRISSCSLKEAYVRKMVKVPTDGDRWSLISLSNNRGRNVELKFVDTMKRQFEFSVDSFQIILDSLLLFHECAEMPMSETFYPSVVGESVYGDFQAAFYHLNCRLISTRNPEEIRGGGLLKYCDLLVREYHAADAEEIKTLERYMCSRFFIDFSDINQQRTKLESYLVNHFTGDEQIKYDYLNILHKVVNDSTVCLMGHERRQTLSLIEELAYRVYFQEQQRLFSKQQMQTFDFQYVNTGTFAPTSPQFQYIVGPNHNGYYVTPFVPTQYPSQQQQPSYQSCTCSWMSCT